MEVPRPGVLETSNDPPIAASLSWMPCKPVPSAVDAVSKPAPSSTTVNTSDPLAWSSVTLAALAAAGDRLILTYVAAVATPDAVSGYLTG